MAAFKLSYFNGKGLAEVSRLIAHAAGVEFEDHRVAYIQSGNPEFVALKPTLPFGQVPLLTIGAFKLAQSKAIERFLASKYNLFGANAEEHALIDSFAETVADIKNKYTAAKVDDAKKAVFFSAEGDLVKYLAFLEAFVTAAGTGYLSSAVSYADVLVYHLLTHYFGADSAAASAAAAHFPGITGVVAHIAAIPSVAAFEAARPSRNEQF